MRAEILSVGTELLIGQTVNTNATFLAQELASLGVDVHWVVTVGDNFDRLARALSDAAGRADLVVITGGLGPTADDITVEAIARHLGEPLEERPDALAHIEALFKQRNRPMAPSNRKQALFPPTAQLIPNPAGTALGLAAEQAGVRYWAFPGVPSELKRMWAEWAKPTLSALSGETIHSALLKYVGIPEATLAEQVSRYLEGSNPTVAPYAGNYEVHLRVTAKAETVEAAKALMAPVVSELRAIAPFYYGQDDDTLPSVIGRMLLERGEWLGIAESCTGGLLASRITDVAGSSRYMRGSVVCYATDVKTGLVGVEAGMIAREGVVSGAVAEALAERARSVLGAEWGIGVTGYASPGPEVKEPGLVWIAVADGSGVQARAFRYGRSASRETIKLWATQSALDMLRRRLMGLDVRE